MAGRTAASSEAAERYVACTVSNAVVVGLRGIEAQTLSYDALGRALRFVRASAEAVDASARRVRLGDGTELPYDRLIPIGDDDNSSPIVPATAGRRSSAGRREADHRSASMPIGMILSPGIDLRLDAVPGYGTEAAEAMPHAWKAGAQTMRLARQLAAMPEGGTVVLSAPANPYRCPPGPYERASLIAHFLKTGKPRAKLILLDAKDSFSKQKLFEAAWAKLYPDVLEYVPLAAGGQVSEVDPAAMVVRTDFAEVEADVACITPPQRAGRIAVLAGCADRSGWCPIDPATFASRLVPGIHVIGDAAIAGAMPKGAVSARP